MVTAAGPTPDDGPFKGPVDSIQRIPLAQIHESPHNPRTHYDPEALGQLADSLLQSGQLEPILVRPRFTVSKKAAEHGQDGYELAAGHRRFRAAKLALERSPEGARFRQLDTLLAIVRDLDDKAFIETLNVDNLQRADLHPLEEAQGFSDLMTSCGYTIAKIAGRIGKSERYVYDSLALRKLIPQGKELFLAGRFERGHAILLARLTPEWQKKALDTRAKGVWQAEVFDESPGQRELPLADKLKPVSVRELQTWIDDNVRASEATVDPFLFPDRVQLLAEALQKKGRGAKIVHITYDYRVPDAARDPTVRTYGEAAWKRADGKFESKTCQHAVVGLVVAGPGRNDAFPVCVAKDKCTVHWREEQQAAERRRKELASYRRQAVRDQAQDSQADKPAKPAVPEPDEACRQRVGDAMVADLYPGILKSVRAIVDKLALPDDISWNVAHTILQGDGLREWADPPKRPGYYGGAHFDDSGIWERGLLPKLLRTLPGDFDREDNHRRFKNAAGARTGLAVEIYLARDFDADAIDKRFEKELKAAWAAELKARAKAEAATKAKKPAKARKAKAAKKGKALK